MAHKGQSIWVERALIESAAFCALKTAYAHKILDDFFTKRQFESIGRKGEKNWIIKNNGLIEFTYKEALAKYGFSEGTFRNAIDELRHKGFIDIASGGQGIYKATNLYSISNRWRNYGTPDYEQPKPRPKSVNRGFQKGNQYGRNCYKEKKTTVMEQHSSTVTE
jgi:hypothetical protein